MLGRVIGTIAAILFYGWANFLLNPVSTILTAKMAGKQFENSDIAYVQSYVGMNFFSSLGVPFIALLAVLIWIWWKPVKDFIAAFAVLIIGATLLLASPHQAQAFFEKTDRTEAYPILPNQSAFWIPDIGDTMNNQAHLDSDEYKDAKKVQFKRFVVPHMLLKNSAGTTAFFDYYVPTGRLIIVDRTPYTRDWQGKADVGTSTANQEMACQTKEGLDWAIGMSIGVSVEDKNAFKFLDSFGIVPPEGKVKGTADTIDTDGRILYQSVYYSRTVADVMDNVAHREIHTMVCREVMARTLDDANTHMNEMLAVIETQTREYLASYGITMKFVGFSNTARFSDKVQDAIDRRYIAAQDKWIAEQLGPQMDTITSLANAGAIRSFGEKTDGHLPGTYVAPMPAIASPIINMPSTLKASPATPAAPAR